MDSKRIKKDCSLYDLAGNPIPVYHDFVHGVCRRCGEIEPKEKRVTQKKYSGKSKSENAFGFY